MERIVLDVDEQTVEAWNRISPIQRKKITEIVSKALNLFNQSNILQEPEVGYARPSENELLAHKKRAEILLPAYIELVEAGKLEAASNGLTQELLDELLLND